MESHSGIMAIKRDHWMMEIGKIYMLKPKYMENRGNPQTTHFCRVLRFSMYKMPFSPTSITQATFQWEKNPWKNLHYTHRNRLLYARTIAHLIASLTLASCSLTSSIPSK